MPPRSNFTLFYIALFLSTTLTCLGSGKKKEHSLSETSSPQPAPALPAAPMAEGAVSFVNNHKAVGVLVLPKQADGFLKALATDFATLIKRSTGAEIPIITSEEELSLPKETARLFIGFSPQTVQAGLKRSDLPKEGYRILVANNAVYIVGRDTTSSEVMKENESQPTRWAMNYLLENELGVRWLWPGELGTYVPKKSTFSISPMDRSYQPKLLFRRVRVAAAGPIIDTMDSPENQRLYREALEWTANHQAGARGRIRFGHSFGKWWDKYGKDHPDYFAEPPPGITNPPFDRPDRIKLRLSNPDVITQIAKEYVEAGMPEFYNVCPNDGSGFDLSAETRAWDFPAGQALDDIWNSRANLTARYVTFWNLLHQRLKELNPDVKLTTYAYYSYKTPPSRERPLTAKTVIGIVCGYRDYDLWRGWANQPGTHGMYLRPNWGHIGANAPYLPLGDMAKFMKFAWDEQMLGFDLDSILGFWSTQGLNYYLWARMMSRPDLTEEMLLEEYTAAFGKGAPKIREYFEYWMKLTEEYNYPEVYSSSNETTKNGRFAELMREGKTVLNYVLGPRNALPYLYSDDVLRPGYALLAEARSLIGDSDHDALARVAFLQSGLDELAATRDVIFMSHQVTISSPAGQQREFLQKVASLDKLRQELTPTHAIWGERLKAYELRRRIHYRPESKGLPALNFDGM